MKFCKSYLLISLFFLTCILHAQITITSSDMPSVFDTIRISTANNIQGHNPALTGPNYYWNYSSLNQMFQEIDTFNSVTSTPVAYQFFFNNNFLYPSHKASYAIRGQDFVMPPVVPIPLSITEVYNFSKNSSLKYEHVGFGSKINGIPSSTRNIPIDVEYEFPLNYADSNFSNSKWGITLPSVAYYGQTMERQSVVDGWGSVSTPLGTYNALRVKSVISKVDTFYLDTLGLGTSYVRPIEIEYKWLIKGGRVPILKVVVTAGIISSIEYQDTIRVVGVLENESLHEFKIYPNPTNGNLKLSFVFLGEFPIRYLIKNISGVILLNEKLNVVSGLNIHTVDLAEKKLQPGMYIVEIQMQNKTMAQKIIFNE